MTAMDANQHTPTSELDSPQSRNADAPTYGTPTEPEPATAGSVANESDAQLIVSAGRSLKNMLVDLMPILESQAKSKVFIEGDFTLRVDGRKSYTIKLLNEDGIEPSNLKVKIVDTTSANGDANGSNTSKKRKIDHVDLTSDEVTVESSSKQARTSEAAEENTEDDPKKSEAAEEKSDPLSIMQKLQEVSSQVKWVEECRRVGTDASEYRQETWRNWMVGEMGWQRNMLLGLTNDLKGLSTFNQSLKWETPQHLVPTAPPPTMPMPARAFKGHENQPLGRRQIMYQPKQKSATKPSAPVSTVASSTTPTGDSKK